MKLSALNTKELKRILDSVLNKLLITFFFCLLIVYASREISDLDIWLHLKTGQYIIEHRNIPLNDIFSFSIHGKPWINHEWLFQAILFLFNKYGGPDGMILMQNIALIATFLLLFVFGRRLINNYIFIFIVLYLTLLSSAYRFTIRPDIFSLFFLMLYLFIIKRFGENKTKLIWLIPLFQAIWTNIHGFSFTGPLIILIFLLSEILKRSIKLPIGWKQTERLDDTQIKELSIVLILAIIATFINPYGLKGAAYPLSVVGQISGKGKIVFQYIQELAKPIRLNNIFNFKFFTYYKTLIILSLFSFRFNQKNINIANLLIWLFFLWFSLIAIRNVAYFAIVAAFIIFSNVATAFKNNKVLPDIFKKRKVLTISNYCLIAILFIFPVKGALKYLEVTTYNFDTYELKSSMWGISENRYPKKAVEFILENNFPKIMYNDFNSGSYLIGNAFPKRQVFIDGRTELYGPEFFSEYVALSEGKRSIIEKIVKKYDIQGFFLTVSITDLHLGLLRYLTHSADWKVVYFDPWALILLKNTTRNSALIKKYQIDLNNWTPPEPDLLKIGLVFRYPYTYLNRAKLLNSIGFYKSAYNEAEKILKLAPNNAEAFKFIANYYFEIHEYKKAYEYARNSLIFAPGDLLMASKIALIYYHLGEQNKALKIVNSIIKNNPKFAEAYYAKAIILGSNTKEAIDLLKTATKLSPKEPRFHKELGKALEKIGSKTMAKKEFEKAAEYEPYV